MDQDVYLHILEERLKQASDTISFLNTGITVIGILLGVMAIVLPFITYQFGIKPSQDALKDFERRTDEKIAVYFENMKKVEVGNAIDKLTTKDRHQQSQGMSFLLTNTLYNLSEAEILRLIIVAKKKLLKDSTQNTLNTYLAQRKSEFITEYLKTELLKELDNPAQNGHLLQCAIEHFVRFEKGLDIGFYKQLFGKSRGGSTMYAQIIYTALIHNPVRSREFFSCRELVDVIKNDPDIESAYSGITRRLEENGINCSDTYFISREWALRTDKEK